MNCPKCGSENLQKKGKRLGNQRYRCKDCGASFTEGVPYKEAPSYEELEKKCSRCGGTKIVRDGKLEDGAQRYLCKECGLRFSDNSTESLTIRWECPYCGAPLNYSGYGKLGQREYKCTSCGKSCSGDIITGKPIKKVAFSETNDSVVCPCCNTKNVRKAGIAKGGRQKYHCNECGKQFMTDYRLAPKEIGLKEHVIQLILRGRNLKEVCNKYGFSERYTREFMEPFFASEKVTEAQKVLIIRYGVFCKVPVAYLASYVKCSERMCRKIINKYKEKLSPPTSVPS